MSKHEALYLPRKEEPKPGRAAIINIRRDEYGRAIDTLDDIVERIFTQAEDFVTKVAQSPLSVWFSLKLNVDELRWVLDELSLANERGTYPVVIRGEDGTPSEPIRDDKGNWVLKTLCWMRTQPTP